MARLQLFFFASASAAARIFLAPSRVSILVSRSWARTGVATLSPAITIPTINPFRMDGLPVRELRLSLPQLGNTRRWYPPDLSPAATEVKPFPVRGHPGRVLIFLGVDRRSQRSEERRVGKE